MQKHAHCRKYELFPLRTNFILHLYYNCTSELFTRPLSLYIYIWYSNRLVATSFEMASLFWYPGTLVFHFSYCICKIKSIFFSFLGHFPWAGMNLSYGNMFSDSSSYSSPSLGATAPNLWKDLLCKHSALTYWSWPNSSSICSTSISSNQ